MAITCCNHSGIDRTLLFQTERFNIHEYNISSRLHPRKNNMIANIERRLKWENNF